MRWRQSMEPGVGLTSLCRFLKAQKISSGKEPTRRRAGSPRCSRERRVFIRLHPARSRPLGLHRRDLGRYLYDASMGGLPVAAAIGADPAPVLRGPGHRRDLEGYLSQKCRNTIQSETALTCNYLDTIDSDTGNDRKYAIRASISFVAMRE